MAALVVLLSFVLVPMAGATQETPPSEKPNIVFILADDLDTYTLNQMETTRTLLADQGVIFKNATFSDPLCCPSRATMQRGQYPHNTGVETDDPPNGGFEAFYPRLEAIPMDMENWRQIRTTEFAYHYYPKTGEEELYDLKGDPYQLANLLHGGVSDMEETLRARYRNLAEMMTTCSGVICRNIEVK